MASPVTVIRGQAQVEGVAGTFDAILYSIQQSLKATQNFEEEVVKDPHGYDTGWAFRNEHATGDFMLKLVGDSLAHAEAPAQVVGTSAAVSSLGQPFLSPGSIINLTLFQMAAFNGAWQVLSGADLDESNVKVGEYTVKVRKYANAQQAGNLQGGIGYIPQ